MLATLLLGITFLALAIFWLVAMVDVLTNPDRYRNGTQLIWVLVLLLSGPIGALLYRGLGPDRPRNDHTPHDTAPPGRRARLDAIVHPWSESPRS